MGFPIIPPFPADGDPAYFIKVRAFMDALAAGSVEANAAFLQLDAAQAALQASLVATVWASGANYTVNQRVFSPADNYRMYVRITNGAGATDPYSDPTNWLLLGHKAFPLVVVAGTSHVIARNTHYVFTNAAKCTAHLPGSATSEDEWLITWANGRLDNEYNPNGLNLLGQSDSLVDDLSGGGTVWGRYTTTAYGWSLN